MVSNGGGGELPGWAARHLAESGAQALDAPLDDTGPRPRARHRVGRRPTPRDQGRLRGWALATVAVAAAVGTVPLAVSALVREDPPMPRVGTFPVVAPEDLGDEGRAEARADRGGAASTDPALAGVLPQVVAPTAAARPLPAASSRRDDAPARRPARAPAAAPATAPTTVRTPTPSSTAPTSTTTPVETEPRDDTDEENGETGSVTPREGTSTSPTTTTTTRPPERDGLLSGLVDGVGGTATGLLR